MFSQICCDFSRDTFSFFLKINPESALQKTNKKFLDRFSIVEHHAGDNIKNLEKEAPHMKSSISRNLSLKIKNLPPTIGTDKITNVVKEYGFKWESTDQIFEKLEEEISELKEAIKCNNDPEIKNEFGDIYFTLLNLSNFLKINPESALQKTNKKFLNRFSIVEEHAGDNIKKQTPKDFQRLWQIAKEKLAGKIPKSK